MVLIRHFPKKKTFVNLTQNVPHTIYRTVVVLVGYGSLLQERLPLTTHAIMTTTVILKDETIAAMTKEEIAVFGVAEAAAAAKDDADDDDVVTVIHCWSAPRSRSTALLYSFEARNSLDMDWNCCIALDEPLYAAWLLQESMNTNNNYNITRPYLQYIQKAAALTTASSASASASASQSETMDATETMIVQQWEQELVPFPMKIRNAVTQLLNCPKQNPPPSSSSNTTVNPKKVIFCKHMAKFWNLYAASRSTNEENYVKLSDTTMTTTKVVRLQHCHILLLRDPVDVVTSWNAIGHNNTKTSNPPASNVDDTTTTTNTHANSIEEIGIVPMLQIYSALQYDSAATTTTAKQPPKDGILVLDAAELISHPQDTLQRICDYCHIPYLNSMYVFSYLIIYCF
jgi:hypothetical protein